MFYTCMHELVWRIKVICSISWQTRTFVLVYEQYTHTLTKIGCSRKHYCCEPINSWKRMDGFSALKVTDAVVLNHQATRSKKLINDLLYWVSWKIKKEKTFMIDSIRKLLPYTTRYFFYCSPTYKVNKFSEHDEPRVSDRKPEPYTPVKIFSESTPPPPPPPPPPQAQIP